MRLPRIFPASWEVKRLRLSLQLLLQRSGALFVGADLLFLLIAVVLFVSDGDPNGLYFVIVAPFVVLGVPILSDLVALERRAGSLDLALSAPGSGHYFERRVLGFGLVMVAQGWGVLALGRAVLEEFAMTPALIQIAMTVAFLASAVLLWATRLRNGSAVILATMATLALFLPWFLRSPLWRGSDLGFWSSPAAIFIWAKPNLVMGASTIGMYLYARRRLDRPELLLG